MSSFVMVLMLGLVAVMAGVLAADDGMPLWAHGYNAPPPPAGVPCWRWQKLQAQMFAASRPLATISGIGGCALGNQSAGL
jgi:hypothetical protein